MGSLPINTLIRSIAVDTITPDRVYAAGSAGLFRSDDAGKTWVSANEGLSAEPLAVTLDPVEPKNVFVLLADNSIWRSTDGTITWELAK